MQTKIRVLGGLPITVEFSTGRVEPDVGVMLRHIEGWRIVEIDGRPLRKKESADWLYARIAASKGEEERIFEALLEAVGN